MAKFLVLYRAPTSAREQMAGATPEQAQAGMDAWTAWSGKAGSAIVDYRAPLGDGQVIGSGTAHGELAGYSIHDGGSHHDLTHLLDEPPHRHNPGGSSGTR